jgi:hypothetical protein
MSIRWGLVCSGVKLTKHLPPPTTWTWFGTSPSLIEISSCPSPAWLASTGTKLIYHLKIRYDKTSGVMVSEKKTHIYMRSGKEILEGNGENKRVCKFELNLHKLCMTYHSTCSKRYIQFSYSLHRERFSILFVKSRQFIYSSIPLFYKNWYQTGCLHSWIVASTFHFNRLMADLMLPYDIGGHKFSVLCCS